MGVDEFRSRLLQHARAAVERAPRAQSEAAAGQYLVLPFFQLLGYDPLNPDEVIPEAHASFSDKFKNRVDFAICQKGQPVIAVECKKVGALNDSHRGELKGYFNAVPTVKLGVLTDGLVWQLYSDTARENMMDDEAFVAIDLRRVADGQMQDFAFDALLRLRRDSFDPADVGSDARRKMFVSAYLGVLENAFNSPSEPLVRALMDLAKMDGRRTSKMVEEHSEIIREAMQAFLDKKILERIGFADRGDLVNVRASLQGGAVHSPPVGPAVATVGSDNGSGAPDRISQSDLAGEDAGSDSLRNDAGGIIDRIVTTDTELSVFEYVRRRLPFLIDRDDGLFAKLDHLYHRDYKTRFTVCYKQDRNGRLFNFTEMAQGPRYRFEFGDSGRVVNTDTLHDIDAELLSIYMKRVAELG